MAAQSCHMLILKARKRITQVVSVVSKSLFYMHCCHVGDIAKVVVNNRVEFMPTMCAAFLRCLHMLYFITSSLPHAT